MTYSDQMKQCFLGKWAVLYYLMSKFHGPKYYLPPDEYEKVYSYKQRKLIYIDDAIEEFAAYLEKEIKHDGLLE